MKFLKLIPLLLLPAVVLPSCSDDDNERDNTATLTLPTTTNFIASYDNTTGTLNSLPGASFNITVNYSASTYQVSVSDLQYAPGQVATSFVLPELHYAVTNDGWEMEHEGDIKVDASNGVSTISDLKVVFNLRATGDQTLVALSFTIDHRYDINTVLVQNVFVGTTSSVDMTDPTDKPFSTKNPQYFVQIDKTGKTAILRIAYPQFVATMPTSIQVMDFPGIPLTITREGFSLNASEIIPEIKGTPYPNFKITNLHATVETGDDFDLTFECEHFNRRVTVEGKAY